MKTKQITFSVNDYSTYTEDELEKELFNMLYEINKVNSNLSNLKAIKSLAMIYCNMLEIAYLTYPEESEL